MLVLSNFLGASLKGVRLKKITSLQRFAKMRGQRL